MKGIWGNRGFAAVGLLLLLAPLVFAQSAKQDVVTKLCTIVDFVQYVAGAVGVLFVGILGVQFVTSGTQPQRREELKMQAGLVLLGLFVVLVSKSLVGLILPAGATC